MKLSIYETPEKLGVAAAAQTAQTLNAAIKACGRARILLSTGASQFAYLEALVRENVDWSKVEMFHLDEYVGISVEHKASFKKYLIERFTSKVPLKKAYFVDGTGDIQKNIAELTEVLNEHPIDVGAIGIGENAHIAFNDPPADFDDTAAYKVVDLAERCKQQQVGEGWFENIESVCKQAVTMTCTQIMKCKQIISVVPYAVKADAILATLQNEQTNEVPATLLKSHPDFFLYCDKDSISKTPSELVKRFTEIK